MNLAKSNKRSVGKVVRKTPDAQAVKKLSDAALTIRRGNSINAIVKALFEAADTKNVSRAYLRKVLKPVLDADFQTIRDEREDLGNGVSHDTEDGLYYSVKDGVEKGHTTEQEALEYIKGE